MTKRQVVQQLIGGLDTPKNEEGGAFAPSNIALCKYWGKRDAALNVPVNSSLSVSLGHLGTHTALSRAERSDIIVLNGSDVDPQTPFGQRLQAYLDLFRPTSDFYFHINTQNNFPTAAGLASSASGYAALVLALDEFFGWSLDTSALSILARLGSGSASRSVYSGFVQWHRGDRTDGMDSYAEALPQLWPELRLAVVTVSSDTKPVSSTEGMKQTVATSTLYNAWPQKATRDIELLRSAIAHNDFDLLGKTAESNALAMHATMIDTQPPVLYWLPETVKLFHQIWELRSRGHSFYFTIDAGPNVKILFLESEVDTITQTFPGCDVITPFTKST